VNSLITATLHQRIMGVAKKTRKFAAVKRVIGMVFGGS
jgi:hypothetical protein